MWELVDSVYYYVFVHDSPYPPVALPPLPHIVLRFPNCRSFIGLAWNLVRPVLSHLFPLAFE